MSLKVKALGRIVLQVLSPKARNFFGIGKGATATTPASRGARAGLICSSVFLLLAGFSMIWVTGSIGIFSLVLTSFGVTFFAFSFRNRLTLGRANTLALAGHLFALFSFYIFYTRIVDVTYVTDAIVGTQMGVLKVLQLQNPYAFSIKPLMDQLGFPPSLYTPRVDGSFEFHLAYPALNFLSMIPFYVIGLHDLRDGVLVFHIASILVIFGLVPSRLKAISLAPFAFGFPFAIGTSWTDSVWAFFVLLTAVLWSRHKGLGLASFGLAVATKQIVLVAAPFLLIRLLKETEGSRLRDLVKNSAVFLGAFLAPNVPFIIASPSLWWAGAIGPFLPGGIPMVPGGIGLAEILSDFGLAFSPLFYMVATGMVAGVCLVFFARRYDRLNRSMWVLPALILFFYHRSLPNYLAFWAIPFVFESFRYGHPSLSFMNGIVHPAWTPTTWGILRRFRGRVGPSVLVLLVLVSGMVGASGVYAAQVSAPKVEVKVDGIGDPDSLGVATTISVSVTNHGLDTLSPVFFVKSFFLWDLWNSNRTQGLPATVTASYVLTATDALAGLPRGSSFLVQAYDSATKQFLAQSPSYKVGIARPPIANPQFAWWTISQAAGQQVPYGWKLSLQNIDRTSAGINALDQNRSMGVRLRVNSTISLDRSGQLVLSQTVLFNETNLNILVYQAAQTTPGDQAVVGASVTDGTHVLYFVFSGQASSTVLATYKENTTVTLPVGYSAWNTVHLDTQSIWLSQGWSPPTRLDLALFLRSEPGSIFLTNIQKVGLA